MNFDFLDGRYMFKQLYAFCKDAEAFVVSRPELSVASSRKALESVVKTFYISKYGEYKKSANLFTLVSDTDFTAYMDDITLSNIHLIRRLGNNAVHGETISRSEAMQALEALYYVCNELMKYLGILTSYPAFDRKIYGKAADRVPTTIEKIESEKVVVEEEKIAELKEQTDSQATFRAAVDYTEKETRKIYIDNALKEAGWTVSDKDGAILPNTACVEVPLAGMPNKEGVGYPDYILFGNDGKPLAVIEAKRTSVDENVGAQQAKLYADCIEKKWGVRPVVYYTNGYKIQIVDGGGYPARRVFGFYTKAELESIIARRGLRQITDTRINPVISDRPFIQEACTAVCDAFNQKRRMALLVMATGTGKTRCAISIVDVLQRASWAKHVLFLADRTELVEQAKKAFNKYLPNSSVCAVSDNTPLKKKDYDARVILSTYPTMLNLIDREDRKFGVGKFDLIILDECHRSVYNKYQAIIRYFDSLVIGLTATPRDSVDSSTYQLFNLSDKNPTYDYPFEKAVKEGFLVDYAPYDCTSDILKNGLKYHKLSPSEKEKYEQYFSDDKGNFPAEIDKKAFKKHILNLGTIDKVLQTLVNDGLKIESGEKLGKSIIFAATHEHAEKIVKRFKALYPEKGDDYCQLIDYSVKYVSTRIDDFKNPTSEPTIAVTVDMLDTGVDVPEVLNLVFFKHVFSAIKFWQMIGRGTRICKGLSVFSPCKEFFENEEYTDDTRKNYPDKQGFIIFDFCGNFDFFEKKPKGRDNHGSLTLTQHIFDLKTDMVVELQKLVHQENEEHKAYYIKWKNECIEKIRKLNRNLINVSYNLQYVDKYSEEKAWEYVGVLDLKEIKKQIIPLIDASVDSERAKRFDAWLFNMELTELVGVDDYSFAVQVVTTICARLLDMTTIPEIAERKDDLKRFTENEFWKEITLTKLEEVREKVRDLLRHLKPDDIQGLETDFEDTIEKKRAKHLHPYFKNYKQRVIDYLAENLDSPVINKIRNIIPLNESDIKELQRILWEELGTQADYENVSSGDSLGVFVRRIVGLEREAVSKIFAEFLSKYNYNAVQEEFLHQIVTYVLENGDIEPKNLVNAEPFSYMDYVDIFDGNPEAVYELIKRLHTAVFVAA